MADSFRLHPALSKPGPDALHHVFDPTPSDETLTGEVWGEFPHRASLVEQTGVLDLFHHAQILCSSIKAELAEEPAAGGTKSGLPIGRLSLCLKLTLRHQGLRSERWAPTHAPVNVELECHIGYVAMHERQSKRWYVPTLNCWFLPHTMKLGGL
jgi:hypothetical protein